MSLDKKRANSALEESHKLLSFAIEQVPVGIAMYDREGRLVFCNRRLLEIFPVTADLRTPGTSLRVILRAAIERGEEVGIPAEEVDSWIEGLMQGLQRDSDVEAHLYDDRWVRLRNRPSPNGTSMVVVSDISKIKQTERDLLRLTEELRLLAGTDGLTGLANRRTFDQKLEAELEASVAVGCPTSLLLADLDQFKSFNDINGHLAGDDCLKQVARCLIQALPGPAALAARYGGEEFAAILPNTDEDGACMIADTFSELVRDLHIPHLGARLGFVSVSIGVAGSEPDRIERNALELIARTDTALYAAKAAGRNTIRRSAVIPDPSAVHRQLFAS
jgi:diguanylate cyclase (GGDEF)-like protein